MARTIQDIQENQVLWVYSGIDGKCGCGCSGKYTYNPLHKDLAQEERGRHLNDKEFSASTIKAILGMMKRASNVKDEGSYFFFTTNGREHYAAGQGRYKMTPGRIYIAYLVPSAEELDEERALRKKYGASWNKVRKWSKERALQYNRQGKEFDFEGIQRITGKDPVIA